MHGISWSKPETYHLHQEENHGTQAHEWCQVEKVLPSDHQSLFGFQYPTACFIVLFIYQSATRWTFFRVKLVFECEMRYLGFWTLGPLDLWTLGPLPSFNISSYLLLNLFYILLSLPPTLLLWYGLVWGGGVLTFEIEIDYLRLIFDLYIDVEKL